MSTIPPSTPNEPQPGWGAGAPEPGGPTGAPQGGYPGTPQVGGAGGGMPPGPGMPPPPGMGGGQPPKKSKAPLIIGIVAAVLVLCCGGGGAYSYFSGDGGTPSAHDSASAGASDGTGSGDGGSGSGDDGSEDVNGDLDQFHQGDCLTMEDGSNDVSPADCGPGTYTVLKRVDGTTKSSACDDTDATQELYQEGQISHRKDFILCIGKTKGK